MPRHRAFVFALTLLLGVISAPASARAGFLGIQVEVLVDSGGGFGFQGIAPSNGTVLPVVVDVGSTIRFIVGLSGTLSADLTAYNTTVTADDPTEIDYLVGSGVDLTGLTFNIVANPNNTLNDATPGSGQVNSAVGGVSPASVDKQLYWIDYIPQVGLTGADGLTGVDFSVTGVISSTTGADIVTGTAKVQLYPGVPEPATLLLLGSGLAGLAGFGLKRPRK